MKFSQRYVLVVGLIVFGGFVGSSPAQSTATSTETATPYFGVGAAEPDPQLSLPSEVDDWHKDAVVYHLWVAAFHDSDGDGVGDLNGITERLDTLRELGVNTLWLSPFFLNASGARNLHGYDVIDHHRVDPRFGTNEDAFTLVREAHARGMRLIFDFVPNHLSTRHPWFIESRDPTSPKRDWFVWRDEAPAEGWTGFNNRSDWHELGDDYYYGIFWSGMPDLNHRNPDVRREMAEAARYWLDRGFDGIRMDAVRYMFENLDGDGSKADQQDQPETIAWFESWRREVMDPYAEKGYPKFMVAENWTDERDGMLEYFSHDGRPVFDMTLNFPLLRAFTRLDAAVLRNLWEWDADLPAHAWLGNFTSNHDLAADRPGTLFADEPLKQRAQAAWLLLGPGTPFIYYGNEIGQPQGPERGDVKHRKPLNWEEVDRQREDADSLWYHHRELIQLRRASPSIRRGKAQFLEVEAGPEVLAVWREANGESTLTLLNGSARAVEEVVVTLPDGRDESELRWLLGDGPEPKVEGAVLNAGSLKPYEAKVIAVGELAP